MASELSHQRQMPAFFQRQRDMRHSRYSASRQKACYNCSRSKVKCDRKAAGCTRCRERDLACSLWTPASSSASPAQQVGIFDEEIHQTNQSESVFAPAQAEQPGQAGPTGQAEQARLAGPAGQSSNNVFLDFSSLELACPIDAFAISNRWLNPYIPVPGQAAKRYPPCITTFIYRNLNSYTSGVVCNRPPPPFVHFTQTKPGLENSPLQTCLNLVRICEKASQAGIAADILKHEMENLYERCKTSGHMALTEIFQSYLLYTMVIYLRLEKGTSSYLREAMMKLQEIASLVCEDGIVCTAQLPQEHRRPRWEAWIVTEARRRALYVMYLLDSLFCTQDNLPTFLGSELQGLPAPSSKALWRAESRQGWETRYNTHLVEWPTGGLRIDELWPVPSCLNQDARLERQRRVEQWLESVDEFGMMLYAVTCCTHGS